MSSVAAPATVDATKGRLSVRPATPTRSVAPGTYVLPGGDDRANDAILVVPSRYRPESPLPLVVSLHGAGIDAQGPVDFLGPYAESAGFILLALESHSFTWDAITGIYGPDIARMNRTMASVFAECAVDPARVVLEGFSDGASYALGVGITNGDLFSRVVAFSPGFITAADPHGKPPVFISHGREDPVLPIEQASGVIVPELRAAGYVVDYMEYEGVHSVPANVASAAVAWLLGGV